MKTLKFLLFFLSCSAPSLYATSIFVQDTIKANTAWVPDSVLVIGDVTVANGVRLTILPGTYVEFQGHFKLTVKGQLMAVGTQADSIVLTASDTAAGWHGIRFDSTSATNDTSRLLFCKVQYGLATGMNEDTYGGGIYVRRFSKLLISNCAIVNDSASWTGGGIYCSNYSSPVISDNFISNNGAQFGGGILCYNNSSPTISNNTITGNRGYRLGGGVYCWRSSPTLTGNTIANNEVSLYGGGGIYCQNNCFPVLINNTISYNRTANSGGGALFEYYSAPVLTGNTISHNQAYFGGGVYCDSSSPIMANNLIAYNSVTWHGGGMDLYKSALVSTNNTIVNNTASRDGSGIYCRSTWSYIPTFSNTIIWGNTGSGGQVYLNDTGSRPSFAYCDIEGGKAGFAGAGGGASYTGTYENNLEAYPQFEDSANGGFAVVSTSPCINAGTPDTTGLGLPGFDHAGNPRIYPGTVAVVDMGAYEFQGEPGIQHRQMLSNRNISAPAIMRIYNVQGRLIKSYERGDLPRSISLQNLTSGIYVRRISTKYGDVINYLWSRQ